MLKKDNLRRGRKVWLFAGLLIILFSALIVGFSFTFFEGANLQGYMFYDGKETKIYVLDSSGFFADSNSSFSGLNGTLIDDTSRLYIIRLTVRNDYTVENPPPPANQLQISPIDATAYLYLTVQIYSNGLKQQGTSVSLSDFSLPAISGDGLILSSGETKTINIGLLVNQTEISNYKVDLYFLGDSIPLNIK